jgi:hypothetical protein
MITYLDDNWVVTYPVSHNSEFWSSIWLTWWITPICVDSPLDETEDAEIGYVRTNLLWINKLLQNGGSNFF